MIFNIMVGIGYILMAIWAAYIGVWTLAAIMDWINPPRKK